MFLVPLVQSVDAMKETRRSVLQYSRSLSLGSLMGLDPSRK